MAKVTIEVDSEKKSVNVTMDGKKIKDVSSIYVYTEESGYFGINLTQSEKIDDSMKKMTSFYASASDQSWQQKDDESIDHKALASVLLQREID